MMVTLHEYRVVWEIEVYATNPRQAAKEALLIQRDPESRATVFDVYRIDTTEEADALTLLAQSEPVRIDLEKYRRRPRSQRTE